MNFKLLLKTKLEFELEYAVQIATHASERNLLFELQHWIFLR